MRITVLKDVTVGQKPTYGDITSFLWRHISSLASFGVSSVSLSHKHTPASAYVELYKQSSTKSQLTVHLCSGAHMHLLLNSRFLSHTHRKTHLHAQTHTLSGWPLRRVLCCCQPILSMCDPSVGLTAQRFNNPKPPRAYERFNKHHVFSFTGLSRLLHLSSVSERCSSMHRLFFFIISLPLSNSQCGCCKKS